MLSPSASLTTARLVSGRCPTERRKRFDLPLRLMVLTFTTLTFQMDSTAWRIEDQEDAPVDPGRGETPCRRLRLGIGEPVEHPDPSIGSLGGESRTKRDLAHLLVGANRVVAWLRAEHGAAAHPYRATGGAMARSAGALLAPRLLPSSSNLGASLGRGGARAGRRKLSRDHLM